MKPARVAIVIPARNCGAWLENCLTALDSQTYSDFEVLLVDDASTDSSVEEAARLHPSAKVVKLPDRGGFTAAVNAGITESRAELVALLNADTRARPRWLEELVTSLERYPDQVGAVASKMVLMSAPDRMDDAGNELSWWGSAKKRGHGEPAKGFDEPVEVFSVCAGAALYRRSFFETVGLFDPEFESYFEDIDLGFRGRLFGYEYRYVPTAEVLHFGHGSGLSRSRYVRLLTRNRAMTFLKNTPSSLLLRHAATLILGQLYFLLAYRKPLDSAAGYLGLIRRLGHVRRERARLKGSRTLSPAHLDSLLTRELGEPSLTTLVRNRYRRKQVGSQ